MFDISISLGSEHRDYPGDEPYARRVSLRLEEGDPCELSALHLSSHSGTHVDAPAHFIAGGAKLDQVDLRRFVTPAQVVSIEHPECVTAAELESVAIRRGDAVLFRTANSRSGLVRRPEFSKAWVAIAEDAARWCVDAGVSLVGIDYNSVDPFDSTDHPAHHVLLGAEIPILESIDLAPVPDGRYLLVALPLSIQDGEASPVRAVLFGGDELNGLLGS